MPSALDDLRGIQDYIARDSDYYAAKFVFGAFEVTERLEYFPESGRIVPEFGMPTLREIIYGSYRIIYELIDDEVQVLAIVHGKRLLPDTVHPSKY